MTAATDSLPPVPDPRAELARLFALAWPVMLTSLNWTLLHVTDVVVVGLTGTEQAAALGASRAVTFIGIVVALGWLTGILVFAARADGAGDLPETGRVYRHGMVLALALGMVSGVALYALALPMLLGLGVAPDIAPAAADVVRVMAIAYPPQLIIVAGMFFFEGISRPRRVMAINLAILPINAVLAWAWSGGHLGLPALGAVGAAAATATASAIGAVAVLIAVAILPSATARRVNDWRSDDWRTVATGAWQLLRFGAVPALAAALELGGFSILIALSTRFGPEVAHAFQIVFSIHNVTFALALGFGSAAGVRVGNAVGERLTGEIGLRTRLAALAALGATGVAAIAILMFREPLVALFPAEAGVAPIAAAMLLVWAPFIIFDGLQVVFVYALRSLGDQVIAGVNSILAFFVVTAGLGYALVAAGYGPNALAIASGAGMLAATLLHGARFWQLMARARPES